jgi:hypothetical protein
MGDGWTFGLQQPLDKQRDPIQGEFFNTESIENVADSLVREFVQNSLDARTPTSDGVEVRFRLSDGDTVDVDSLFSDLWPHLNACKFDNGSFQTHRCRYLVIEDFGTTGLRGDPALWTTNDRDAPEEEFFHFFRAEGRSTKSGASRGSWGVGKYTFPKASTINTFFGLTIREDDDARPLLMGQAILKNHTLNGVGYKPDGWWTRIESADGPMVPMPFESTDPQTSHFNNVFELARTNEPGLSIVVPFVEDDLDRDQIVRAIIKNYGVAIVTGGLTFKVSTDASTTPEIIDAEIAGAVTSILGAMGDIKSIETDLDLATWRAGSESHHWFSAEELQGNPSGTWPSDLLSEQTRDAIAERLLGSEPFGVKVPILTSPKGEPRAWSNLEVVMRPTDGGARAAHFYREGIRVPDAGSRIPIVGVEALALANDPGLATMLGLAEGPAHMDWVATSERFKQRYSYGEGWLRFVKSAPREILRLVRSADDEEDRELAADYFSLPEEESEPEGHGAKPTPTGDSPEPGNPPPTSTPTRISQISGGFTVAASNCAPGEVIRIDIAYDVRRGSAFSKWSHFDFDLDSEAITVAIEGGTVAALSDNTIEIEVDGVDTCRCSVTGFDPNRDLKVLARRAET